MKVLAVVGPTAAGKSALALSLAKAFHGEIVCMDSMQVYRGMDIGTAKPTPGEQAAIPHHMLDIVEPVQSFSVAEYASQAVPILQGIGARGRLPILAGGTGLYLRALMDGMPLGGAGSDEEVRKGLWAIAEESGGKERLHAMLREVDPESDAKLHPNDLRRVIRALEVFQVTGKPISRQNEAISERSFDLCLIGATMEREKLYARIESRVDQMMADGLMREVKELLLRGVPPDCQAMQGIGYKELIPVAEGALPLAYAVDTLKRNTRRYAKRQWTWFKGEEGVTWLNTLAADITDQAMEIVNRFLASPG
jgi:tRNA dimethylallyltransferase